MRARLAGHEQNYFHPLGNRLLQRAVETVICQ
jgi:hypothetical protein